MMRVRNKSNGEHTLVICVTLSMLSGCIFSSNFGEGSTEASPDMPANMMDMAVAPPDLVSAPDQDITPDQGGPVDSPDMVSMADLGVSTDAGGPADMGEACALMCPPGEQCVIRDGGNQECISRASCELFRVDLRCRAGESCGSIQYSCLGSDFKAEDCPGAMPTDDAICSANRGNLQSRVSGLSLGARQVVVTHEDGALDPVIYIKPKDERWREETPQLPDKMEIQEALAEQGNILFVNKVLHKGVAAAIASDDSVIALTVTLETASSDNLLETKARNAVLLFTDTNTSSPQFAGILLGDGEYFATSLEMEGNYLLTGSPQVGQQQDGYVSFYKYDGTKLDQVGECVGDSPSFGKGLGLASFGANVPFVYASSDDTVSLCLGLGVTTDTADSEDLVMLEEGPSALSVSGGQLLVSILGQSVAHVYTIDKNSGGRVIVDTRKVYQTSHGAIDRAFAVINATGNSPTDAPQIVFDVKGGVEVAPVGHSPTGSESSPFDAYQKLYPTPSANEILAMDANAEGVVVFAVPRGPDGASSDVVFGLVPQGTGN